MPKPTATATIVAVERSRHRYEAHAVIQTRDGREVTHTEPLVDEDQRDEWTRHFTSAATADGHTVEVTDLTTRRR